jgi:hypothetical protein
LPGLDVRGAGGCVICPPSIHPTGRVYRWSIRVADSAGAFADAPDWLITIATGKIHPAGAGFDSVTNAEKWSSFIDEPVEGSQRTHAIARLYGLLVRRYVDPIVSLGLVRMYNPLRCKPPLDDADVVRISLAIASRETARREGRR